MSLTVALSLLHFVWQGALIGAVAWIAMKLTRSANARYVIGVASLAMMALAPLVTATYVGRPAPQGRRSDAPLSLRVDAGLPTSVVDTNAGLGEQAGLRTARWTIEDVRSLIHVSPQTAQRLFVAWLLGVAFLSMRLFFGWLTARRLTRVAVTEPRLEILSHAERIMGALKIQHAVTVLESALVKVPMTMGWWKPVVLLPAAAMTGLSMEQIDALVAHELAHVRRHDYLVNLAQSAIETLLFYHPMVWLISRAVRHERELCCDDLAIAVCGGDTVTYASALADLESMRVAAPALAANGGSLLVRVKRILGHDAAAVSRSRTNWSAGVAIISLALVLLPINAARPKATPLPPGWEEVKADTNLGDGIALLLNKSGADGSVGVLPTNAATTGVRPGGIAGIDPLPPAIDFIRLMAGRPTTTVIAEPPAQTSAAAATQAELRKIAEPTAPTYKLSVADVLRVTVYSGGSSQQDFRLQDYPVALDGTIKLPLIGAVPVAGRTVADTNVDLRKRFLDAGQFADCTVDIVVVEYHGAPKAGSAQAAIAPGQLLRLEVTVGVVRQGEFSKDYTVQPDGFIVLPYVGRTKIAGMSVDAAQEAVRALLAEKGTLPGAKVVASLEGRSSDASIFVLGEVNAPNAYPWREGITVAQAISLASGAKVTGYRIELVTTAGAIEKVADATKRVPAGATINVMAAGNVVVKVQGAVKMPGSVTLREDKTTLPEVLVAAGGLSPSAGQIIRVKLTDLPVWQTYSVAELNNGGLRSVSLKAGDTVDVPVAPKYYVQGFVNSPGEIQWEPNLTLQRAIFKAGGGTKDGALNRVTVKRMDPQTNKWELVDLGKEPLTVIIQPNDVIDVPKRRM